MMQTHAVYRDLSRPCFRRPALRWPRIEIQADDLMRPPVRTGILILLIRAGLPDIGDQQRLHRSCRSRPDGSFVHPRTMRRIATSFVWYLA